MDTNDLKIALVSAPHFSRCLKILRENLEVGLEICATTGSIEEACKYLQMMAENAGSLERAIRFGESRRTHADT